MQRAEGTPGHRGGPIPGDSSWYGCRLKHGPRGKPVSISIQILFPKPAGNVNHCKAFWLGETVTCCSQNSQPPLMTAFILFYIICCKSIAKSKSLKGGALMLFFSYRFCRKAEQDILSAGKLVMVQFRACLARAWTRCFKASLMN